MTIERFFISVAGVRYCINMDVLSTAIISFDFLCIAVFFNFGTAWVIFRVNFVFLFQRPTFRILCRDPKYIIFIFFKANLSFHSMQINGLEKKRRCKRLLDIKTCIWLFVHFEYIRFLYINWLGSEKSVCALLFFVRNKKYTILFATGQRWSWIKKYFG